MKNIKIGIVSSLLIFLMSFPARAAQEDTILVYSNDLSLVVLITPRTYSTAIITIPSETVFPIQCAKQTPATLSSISEKSMSTCMMDTLSSSLSLSITHYIYLDGENIDSDYPSAHSMQDIHTFEQLQAYFSALGVQIKMSVLWKFPQYMDTNLSLWELYDLYELYASEDFTIQYKFLHLLCNGTRWYALDKRLYLAS